MEADHKFAEIASLICEPVRAKMLWSLLDGRAYTAGELALAADISPAAASNHLSKLLNSALIKVEIQGRHRYYSFASPEVAYVIESLASLSRNEKPGTVKEAMKPVRFCRTCYDHLAGHVSVLIAEALEQKGYLEKSGNIYLVAGSGWEWFATLNILKGDVTSSRRALSRQCLDWSERRPHLAGALGAAFLERTLENDWFRKVKFSRELIVTVKGRQQLLERLGLAL
ncbi:ArsR/SmtB family transcription factor [Hufsiella ginkgonis]|uniref:Helix-turn-helix domain-containing protein n=1 Tax=Hufsiella ginkgonis TaxID=2695274 RepID=A0A7K1XWK4_9SPHI|nr:helix-turn-helix transcriptional regulator [Hufsiella ginkgonis]MXV15361.1 helix-turn-helix domain-containing protein [Hufsiella ginkgonis]